MRSLTTIVLCIFSLMISAQTTFEKIVTRNNAYDLNSVIQTADGGFAAMGVFNTNYRTDKWLVRTDAMGDTLWSQVYAGNEKASGQSQRDHKNRSPYDKEQQSKQQAAHEVDDQKLAHRQLQIRLSQAQGQASRKPLAGYSLIDLLDDEACLLAL